MVTFIELPLFTEQITGLLDDGAYRLFQSELLRQPDKGDVIPQSGGLRKVRMRLPGRGKSGGARVIYLHLQNMKRLCCSICIQRHSARISVPSNSSVFARRQPLSKRNLNHET